SGCASPASTTRAGSAPTPISSPRARSPGTTWTRGCRSIRPIPRATPIRRGDRDADPLFLARVERDGDPYLPARDRGAIRAPADVVRQQGPAGARLYRPQPRGQDAGVDRGRPGADRGRGHALLPRQALSRGQSVARGRDRDRGPGGVVDVLYRLDDPPGAPGRGRAVEGGVRLRRDA